MINEFIDDKLLNGFVIFPTAARKCLGEYKYPN